MSGILLIVTLVKIAKCPHDQLRWKREGLRLRSGVATRVVDHLVANEVVGNLVGSKRQKDSIAPTSTYYSRKSHYAVGFLSGFAYVGPHRHRDLDWAVLKTWEVLWKGSEEGKKLKQSQQTECCNGSVEEWNCGLVSRECHDCDNLQLERSTVLSDSSRYALVAI